MLRKWLPFGVVVTLIIAIDQISKNWVLANMQLGETILIVPALHPYFQLTRSYNTGAAFGLGGDNSDIFLVLSMIITVVIIYLYSASPRHATRMHVAMSLVVGGAVGNVIDRIQHGHVIDFVHLSIPGVISNVSNFADHAIVIGVGLLLLDNILRERAARRQNTDETTLVE